MTRYFAKDAMSLRLTVSAVARRNAAAREVLLIQRADNGHWGLPGGHVDPGESVSHAVAREILEETGCRVEVGRLIGVYSDPALQTVEMSSGERAQFVNLCFEAIVVDSDGVPTTPEETLGTGFFAPDDFPEPFVPMHTVRIEDANSGKRAACVR